VEPDAGRAAFYAKGYEGHLARLAEARGRARS
jgi:erythritol kinase (D-erythritol 1-phosphate-forming)